VHELLNDVQLISAEQDALTRLMNRMEAEAMAARRGVVLDDDKPVPASGAVLVAKRMLCIDGWQYPRGTEIPATVSGVDRLLALRCVEWLQAATSKAEPIELPGPDYAVPNPTPEQVEGTVRTAMAKHDDRIEAYRCACDLLSVQMDARAHSRIPDLITTVQVGASLSSLAHAEASRRLAIPYRRPWVRLWPRES
jgi:hypothetical protein